MIAPEGLTKEDWRAVPGYTGRYEVSDRGRVRSGVKTGPRPGLRAVPLILVSFANNKGRLSVWLTGPRRCRQVSRLVLEAFVGPCPTGQECRRKNDDHRDNRLPNLLWGTRLENCADAGRNGKRARGVRNGASRLTESNVGAIRERLARGVQQKVLADDYGVGAVAIHNIAHRKTWKHI